MRGVSCSLQHGCWSCDLPRGSPALLELRMNYRNLLNEFKAGVVLRVQRTGIRSPPMVVNGFRFVLATVSLCYWEVPGGHLHVNPNPKTFLEFCQVHDGKLVSNQPRTQPPRRASDPTRCSTAPRRSARPKRGSRCCGRGQRRRFKSPRRLS